MAVKLKIDYDIRQEKKPDQDILKLSGPYQSTFALSDQQQFDVWITVYIHGW